MKAPKRASQIAVLGLGKVGAWTCRELAREGYEVVAIDISAARVQDLVDEMPASVNLVAADATELGALRELRIDTVDAAAITVGSNVELSVLCAMQLVDMGVPHVVARAMNPTHARVLRRIGVDETFQPARHTGRTLARMAASPTVVDYLELQDGEGLVETEVPAAWRGKTLAQLRLPDQGLVVLVHKRSGQPGALPHGDQMLAEGDRIVVGGTDRALRMSELFVTPARRDGAPPPP